MWSSFTLGGGRERLHARPCVREFVVVVTQEWQFESLEVHKANLLVCKNGCPSGVHADSSSQLGYIKARM